MKKYKYLDDVLGGELKSWEALEREELLQKKIDLLTKYMKLDSNSSVIAKEISKLQKEMEGLEDVIQKSRRLAAEGKALLDEKKYDLAIQKLNEAIELNPNNAEYFNNRGDAYFGKKDYDNAIQDYSKAIELNPNNAIYFKDRGNAYFNKKNYDRAIQDYTKAIELNPNDAVYFNWRGVVYFRKSDWDNAIKDCSKAIELNPNNAVYFNDRGNAYGEKWNFFKARVDWKKAKELGLKKGDKEKREFGSISYNLMKSTASLIYKSLSSILIGAGINIERIYNACDKSKSAVEVIIPAVLCSSPFLISAYFLDNNPKFEKENPFIVGTGILLLIGGSIGLLGACYERINENLARKNGDEIEEKTKWYEHKLAMPLYGAFFGFLLGSLMYPFIYK